jgi:hypothetical protein
MIKKEPSDEINDISLSGINPMPRILLTAAEQ